MKTTFTATALAIAPRVPALALGEWQITPSHGVQLRYVHETCDYQGLSIDGSHVGLGYNYTF